MLVNLRKVTKPNHPFVSHPSNEPPSNPPPTQLHLDIPPPIGSTMPSELDQAIHAASIDLSTRKYTSIRAAAAAHGVDRMTLTRRINVGKSRSIGHES
jgi:hypothetical protein